MTQPLIPAGQRPAYLTGFIDALCDDSVEVSSESIGAKIAARRPTPIKTVVWERRAALAGKTLAPAALADELGCRKDTILYYMRELGFPLTFEYERKLPFTAVLIFALRHGASAPQLARRYGVTTMTVRRALLRDSFKLIAGLVIHHTDTGSGDLRERLLRIETIERQVELLTRDARKLARARAARAAKKQQVDA